MRLRQLRSIRGPRLVALIAILVLLVAGGVVAGVLAAAQPIRTTSQFVDGTPEPDGAPVPLDTTLYLPAHTPAPAILLAHGFGGTKQDLAPEARSLARRGYVVLAYTARGFGASGGLIHLDSPQYEVADGSKLISYLATLPQVSRTSSGAPKVGVAGSSYGGALALLLAAYDHRVDAVVADITWSDLNQALFPNASGDGPGVFKKMWAGDLFTAGMLSGGLGSGAAGCGRYAPDVCSAMRQAATTGVPDEATQALLAASSPAGVLDRITAPVLLIQGEQDSLFGLDQVDENARGIAANGTLVRVMWRAGGHDTDSGGNIDAASGQWFDALLRGRGGVQHPFSFALQSSAISSQTGLQIGQELRADAGYPGIEGDPAPTVTLALGGPAQTIDAPAGGTPAAITAVPGLGGLGPLTSLGTGGDTAAAGVIPGQVAVFSTAPLATQTLVAGTPTVELRVTTRTTSDATLFLGLRDVAPDGTSTLPSDLVAPLRLTGLTPGRAQNLTVTLPGIVRQVAAGHRLELTVATTDIAYALPSDQRDYTISVAGGVTSLTLPTVQASVLRAGHPIAWLLAGVLAMAVVLAGLSITARRRSRGVRDPRLAPVPVSVEGLVKEYGDGFRAVDDVTFGVLPGQVVGLLGPNGAGKTTTLRVLMGLIAPTSGRVRVFGETIRPGSRVLSRVGAFVEGPGFLPHLSGRDNLRLFWAASGRPEPDAQMDVALQIAGLGHSVDRRVKTYSHGMKQRLAIAQAMLGLPDLLVLDEPTNGLDPPQIAEMREVLAAYATTGRTVIVSSHLLAEVEQTCSHVVVMHRGRVIASGSVSEIAGAGGMQVSVDDPAAAVAALDRAGIRASLVPARRALEEVFLDMVGGGRDD